MALGKIKRVEEIDFGTAVEAAKWTHTTNPDGTITHTTTAAVPTLTFWLLSGRDQPHQNLPSGWSFTENPTTGRCEIPA